jgi:hypothetical protein
MPSRWGGNGSQDVLSVAFSVDNRQIVSGSRDKTIKLWNTLGECKYTIQEQDGHSEWVSCVRFSPVTSNPIIVSAGWDKLVKVRATPRSLLHAPALVVGCDESVANGLQRMDSEPPGSPSSTQPTHLTHQLHWYFKLLRMGGDSLSRFFGPCGSWCTWSC